MRGVVIVDVAAMRVRVVELLERGGEGGGK